MESESRQGTDWSKVSLAIAIVALMVAAGSLGMFLLAPQESSREPQRLDVRVVMISAHMEADPLGEKHLFVPGTIIAHVGDVLHLTFVNMDEHNHSLAIPALAMESPKVAGSAGTYEFEDILLTRAGTFEIVCTVPYVAPNDCGIDHSAITGQLVVLA